MKKITAKEFDEKFDNNEDIDEFLDFSTATRLKDIKKLKTDTKKVNVDFPEWVINSLDEEAKKIGVTRQSIIKVWIAERLKEEAKNTQQASQCHFSVNATSLQINLDFFRYTKYHK